ncbi:MAG: TetR/AcrR family transcriptional regulator C-terminal domain-containing protein [Atopobiaceae bacterium]|nr:TetR/AcrR family transcriptional regulator C-terminal domain-containing protein [Atopobiaceae bacterium]
MATHRDTKGMFAKAIEEMMASISLSKVHVADLCLRCGVERRVFYYHFRDKYDLVAWIFERDYVFAADGVPPFSKELFAKTHRRLWERREFYRRAFEEDSQNSIRRYLLQFSVQANEAVLRRHLGVTTLSSQMAFEARHFAYGNVGCVIEWLGGGIKATPEQLASQMFCCMSATLREAYAARQRSAAMGSYPPASL